jgi:hypothetical protein
MTVDACEQLQVKKKKKKMHSKYSVISSNISLVVLEC